MANLKSLDYHYLYKLEDHDFEPDAPKPYLLNACGSKVVFLPGRSTPIELHHRVYLKAPFVAMNPSWRMTSAKCEQYPSLAKAQGPGSIAPMLEDDWCNYGIWEATPSVNEDMMWGVDLILDSIGGFEVNALMEKFEPQVRYLYDSVGEAAEE